MLTHDQTDSGPVALYRCSECGRTFMAVGYSAAGDIPCACGSQLHQQPMRTGLYELMFAVTEDERTSAPGEWSIRRPTHVEPDLGYGLSHGNPPGHAGPSGPGDAPAR